MTTPSEESAETASGRQGNGVLFLALELGRREWKLGFATGMGKRPRERTVKAGNVDALEVEIERAKDRFKLPPEAEVVSCYEAGRDGFWIHRFLESIGVASHVVDSSSIEVKRRRRKRKTDRLDLEKLLRLLIRDWGGEKKVWSVVRVPSPEAEDSRHLHRELMTLKRDRTRVTNRIRAALATQGVLDIDLSAGFETWPDDLCLWDGLGLGGHLRARLRREWELRGEVHYLSPPDGVRSTHKELDLSVSIECGIRSSPDRSVALDRDPWLYCGGGQGVSRLRRELGHDQTEYDRRVDGGGSSLGRG